MGAGRGGERRDEDCRGFLEGAVVPVPAGRKREKGKGKGSTGRCSGYIQTNEGKATAVDYG